MTFLDLPRLLVLIWLFVIGLALGSFLNVCIHRIPQRRRLKDQIRGLWHPRSMCPRCGYGIPARDNVPILSWIMLRGKCRSCRQRISIRYPAIELLNGLLFVVVYCLEVPAGGYAASIRESCLFDPNGPQMLAIRPDAALLNLRYAYHMVMIEALVVATFIDLDLRIIPDGSTVPAMCVGLLGGGILAPVYVVPVWFSSGSMTELFERVLPAWLAWTAFDFDATGWATLHPHLHGFAVSICGFLVGGGVVWLVRLIGFQVLKREAMGFGDVVLMAMIGSFIGWQPVVAVFFVAPVLALAVVAVSWLSRRQREIPYGPYLSVATLVVLLDWPHVGPAVGRVFSTGPIVFFMAVGMTVSLWLCLQLMQLARRLLGIPLYPQDAWTEQWTSADQLQHFSGETIDDQQGRWRRALWEGCHAGRGLSYDNRWRRES